MDVALTKTGQGPPDTVGCFHLCPQERNIMKEK